MLTGTEAAIGPQFHAGHPRLAVGEIEFKDLFKVI